MKTLVTHSDRDNPYTRGVVEGFEHPGPILAILQIEVDGVVWTILTWD